MVDFVVEFRGKAAHAAFDPWNGRSALDAAELFTHGLNLMREHVRPTVAHALRDPERRRRAQRRARARRGSGSGCATRKHARWTSCSSGCARSPRARRSPRASRASSRVQGGDYEMLVNMTGARLLQANLDWLGPLPFTRGGAGVREDDPARDRRRGEGARRRASSRSTRIPARRKAARPTSPT